MRILGIMIFLTVAAAAAYFFLVKPPSSQTIDVIKPLMGPAVQAVYATGTVEPSVMVPVAPRISARLVELLADEGHEVAKDQLLARLEDEDLKQELAEMQANAELARKDYERRQGLIKSGAASQRSVDEAKASWETAQAKVAQAEANLKYTELRSPEQGMVIRRDGEVGQLIAANQPVFWLSCCAGLRVSAEVDEEDISLVKPGQKVLIRADAYPGKVFKGVVQNITPKGDPVARSYRVRISLEPDSELFIGMTAEANIVIRETKEALLVPPGAVNDNTVWIVQNGRPVQKQVQVGAKTPQAVEILSGVNAGDVLVLDASRDYSADQPIETELRTWKMQ